jgi:Rieske Fe-S protein
MANDPKGDSLWNWLGRQVGHVKKAVSTPVTKPAPRVQAEAPKPQPTEPPAATPEAPQVIYRDEKAQEVEMPDQPGVKLRRTIIDEVIVEERKNQP